MLLISRLLVVATAVVAIALPGVAKPAMPEVPLCQSPPTAAVMANPPVTSPVTNTVFLDYGQNNCSTSSLYAEYDLVPGTCHSLPGLGGDLKYSRCGQGECFGHWLCISPLSLSVHLSFFLAVWGVNRSAKLLLFTVVAYVTNNCSGTPVVLPKYSCYNINTLYSFQLVGC